MTMSQTASADDLLHRADDGFRYELVKGELKKMTPSGHEHGRVAANFTWHLTQRVKEGRLGAVYAAETGFLLSSNPDTVRAPDVAFISRRRLQEIGTVEGFWPGPPDLAVEVVSPRDTYAEVEEKVTAWLKAGTALVVVLNPVKRTATVYRSLAEITILNESATLEIEDLIPGFKVAVQALFE